MATQQAGLGVVGVVGAGTMGAGIAQLALENGHEVVLHDIDEAALERGRVRVRDGLIRRAARLDLDGDSIDDWVSGRLGGLRDALTLDAVGAEAEIVFEAALEDVELKQAIFRALDAAAAPDVILATNTSALSVGAIAAPTRHPERVIGLHFFNPAPVMPLVEVVIHPGASPAAAERGSALMERWGKTPVRSADTPGFIVNRVNRPFTIQALRSLEAGFASIETIDQVIRAAGFPMGPFELMDLVGIDVNLAAATGVWHGLGRPERLRPSRIQEQLVADGALGRKAEAGFYKYDGGRVTARWVSIDDAECVVDPIVPLDVICDRIVLGVVDEAYRALDEGVASRDDIDRALRLGAAHPIGPFERVREAGGAQAIRERLLEVATDLDVEPDLSPLLVREATAGATAGSATAEPTIER